MAKHTAGPWEWRRNGDRVYLRTINRGGLYIMDFVRRGMQGGQPRFAVWDGDDREKVGGIMCGADEIDLRSHPDARLIAAAPDHAAIAHALCSGVARWEPFTSGKTGEFCIAGLRHCTTLDEFGVPVMTDHMRAAIAKATEAANGLSQPAA